MLKIKWRNKKGTKDVVRTILFKSELVDGKLLTKGALNGIFLIDHDTVTKKDLEIL